MYTQYLYYIQNGVSYEMAHVYYNDNNNALCVHSLHGVQYLAFTRRRLGLK